MKRTTTKPAARLTVGMEIGLGNPNAEADALDALLADLDSTPVLASADEIVEPATDEVQEHAAGELEIEAADPGAEPTETVETVEDSKAKKAADKAAKKAEQDAARAAVAAKRKAEREEKAAKRAAEKVEKPAPVPRKHYASKVERVTDKLGEHLGDYTVLTLSDASLTGDELKAKQAETLEVLKGAGVKVQNRMTMLLEFVAGKSSKLNEVIERAFKLLKADGYITVGEKGNFHQNLLSKPYSAAAARAMGNNTLAAMRDFKVIAKDAEGKYVANPESLILMKINGMLGL